MFHLTNSMLSEKVKTSTDKELFMLNYYINNSQFIEEFCMTRIF